MSETIETKTDAQVAYQKSMAMWVKSNETEAGLEAAHWLASSAMQRAEEVHAEHDRMIIDAQGAIIDLATGKLVPPQLDDLRREFALMAEHVRDMQATINELRARGNAGMS